MTAGSVSAPHIIPVRAPVAARAQARIDTATPVEITSGTRVAGAVEAALDGSHAASLPPDSPGAKIHFTLDGSRPEATRRPGTLLFTAAIHLPAGRVTVKALAASSDGRESAVVTKVFQVEEAGGGDEDAMIPETLKRSPPLHGADRICSGSGSRGPPRGPGFLRSRRGPRSALDAELVGGAFRSLTSTQMSRIQRETDFLRCPCCLSQRASDPLARFCSHCGAAVPPLPGRRLPPTEGGQMVVCVDCRTTVPANTSSCVACEAPIPPQLTACRLQVLCAACGTGNPAHITHCVTCESSLPRPPTPVLSGQSAPPVSSAEGKLVSCSKCHRVNQVDARYCDWCGAKPGPVPSYLTCSRCGSSSHPYANFCGSCGVFLEGPARVQSHDIPRHLQHASTGPDSAARQAADAQTQTAGLFYPSAARLQKSGQQEAPQRSRRPLLTAISPGRGYWRKQLDHVCAHLRSYAQNHPEFRALIGEPRMGRMVSAVIEEDSYEVSIRINLVSATAESAEVSDAAQKSVEMSSGTPNLSSVTEGAGACDTATNRKKGRSHRKSWTSTTAEEELPPLDRHLLKEVGPDGTGHVTEVQQLLEEGADPSCLDRDGNSALAVAVMNGHHDVIPVLVQKGADVNFQSGTLKDTALHVAAALGSDGLKCAETLLGGISGCRCNASLRKKNGRGQSAYDVAVSSGCGDLISLMAARTGQGLLNRLAQPRSAPNPGDF
ncbi:double zinc ribbon and ankyrin repeat-containing protein 1-like isoform X2 [Denticeps clupeoides]|uniref:double zinc ribbon and ankyrin repeat-containing protein 1-like isoform X2 n=1 Tax=Denticeps clupeoides TaxID=299321 RepID=UPI0010A323FB|nr:double zinc ribbon and ankyrin repeat-containing protein 1 isoform X2 [Denticeps clupeoides]